MEKLIELLNEYEYSKELKEVPEEEKDLFVQKIFWHGLYGVLNSYGCEDYEILKRKFCYMYAISKEYGFIKWLVENDKIDIKKLVVKGEMRSGWDFENKKGDEEEGEEIWNKYYSELCLMLLSISDTPIEDLISYLK